MSTSSPLKYLDKALNGLRDLNLVPEKTDEAPIIDLINQISDLDEDKTLAIARTLNQASLFNGVVREQVSSMELGERYEDITNSFNSIRDDAKSMVEQVEDGRIDTWERIGNIWMKVTRGDIPDRFEDIKETYLDVADDSQDQIKREHVILNAYQDFHAGLLDGFVAGVFGTLAEMFGLAVDVHQQRFELFGEADVIAGAAEATDFTKLKERDAADRT